MSDLKILKELIIDKALVTIEPGLYGKSQVVLSETESQTKYCVTIHNIPKESIVIKTDVFPAPKHIFNNVKGECKRADFVIISHTKKTNYIIFIELKQGKGETQAIIQQLKGSQCLIDYFRAIVKVFWQNHNFLNIKNYKYRFISIHHINTNKKPTFTQQPNTIHDKAECLLKVNAPNNLQFNQLICKPPNK
jgi:hypothetical protein